MAYFIPSYIQKRLLRYALSRTGLLDDKSLDLENLDITLGTRNVVELKDLGLNIKRLSLLLQLPPRLRVETARVLSLRLTVPADIYQSAISVDVDGVQLLLHLEEEDPRTGVSNEARRATTQPPQHRKANRRSRSPPPYDSGGLKQDEAYIPTTQDLARSFLQDELLEERRDMEASIAAHSGQPLDESIVSDSSNDVELGTGAGMGLPSFLASFLQGIIDRLQVSVKSIQAKVETYVQEDGQKTVPIALALKIAGLKVDGLDAGLNPSAVNAQVRPHKRRIAVEDIAVELLCDAETLTDLSQLPSPGSPTATRSIGRSPPVSESSLVDTTRSRSGRSTTASTEKSFGSATAGSGSDRAVGSPEVLKASVTTVDTDRFADAGEDDFLPLPTRDETELDIRPGEDNVTWSSRRSHNRAPSSDLWNSMAEEDDLPDSLLFQTERVSTPRQAYNRTFPRTSSTSSGTESPGPSILEQSYQRTPRTVSPYARSQRSPGSWPRPDESPQRFRGVPGPGSWPQLDQSQQILVEPLEPGREVVRQDDFLDSKRTASIEADAMPFVDALGSAMESSASVQRGDDDMSESRIYSGKEAQSIYLSVITPSSRINVPGGWDSDGTPSERSDSPELMRGTSEQPLRSCSAADERSTTSRPEAPLPSKYQRTGDDTPRALSPQPKDLMSEPVSRRILTIDRVSIWLPSGGRTGTPQAEPSATAAQQSRVRSAHLRDGMPGAFSLYSEQGSSPHMPASSSRYGDVSNLVQDPNDRISSSTEEEDETLIELGTIIGQLDVPVTRLTYRIIRDFISPVSRATAVARQEPNTSSPDKISNISMSISLQRLRLSFSGVNSAGIDLDGIPASYTREPLVSVDVGGLLASVNTVSQKYRMDLEKLACFLSEHRFMSFSRDQDLQLSRIVKDGDKDFSVNLSTGKTTSQRKPVTEVNIESLPLELSLDLQVVEETFSTFGGLSGIIELGNSVLSESATLGLSKPVNKPRKGVRFEGDPPSPTVKPETKINVRVGGLLATLKGTAGSVALRTTAVKTVLRQQGASVSIDKAWLSGPYTDGLRSSASVQVELDSLRLDYFFWPRDTDLERLLMLLTPSKDKYEDDDDILVETLLRQRRKGAVMRVSTSDVKVKVSNLECVSKLQALNSELTKLSAVTKYLPEDDRPGLLTLVRVDRIFADLPVHQAFGRLTVLCKDINIAQVPLPALFALGIGEVRIERGANEILVHSMIPTAPSEGLPMIMCRMLGNEVEPVVKVKIFNTCVEYSVPTMLAITGLDEVVKPEDIANLTQSVANLILPAPANPAPLRATRTSSSDWSAKKMKIEVLLHECALGLVPREISSKGLLLLANARSTTTVPPARDFHATLEVRKAAIYVTDDRNQILTENIAPAAVPKTSLSGFLTDRLCLSLSKQGYVSVSSIRSARVIVSIHEMIDLDQKNIEVDVRDELFLLETCADSTQTLIDILNGLAPPTPPSTEPKYLMEPMTIEDMLASFTGDAYARPQPPPETLFDVNEEPEPDVQSRLGLGIDDDDDDLLKDSEMTSSLYGPVSGMIGGDPEDEDDTQSKDFGDTVESLLEEDPFEMPTSPILQVLSDDALMADLQKQCRPTTIDEPVDLGLYEIDDISFDALARAQSVLGAPHRFNTPASTKRFSETASTSQHLPFKLRLRDVQVLWHLYDGYDWQKTRDSITEAVEEVEHKAEERKARHRTSLHVEEEEESVIGDILFNSIYIGVAPKSDVQDLRRQINHGIDDQISESESYPASGMSRPTSYSAGGRSTRPRVRRRLRLERSKHHKITFELKGLSVDVLVFPPGSGETISSVDLRAKDFEIFDNVPTSTWRKFLTHMPYDEFPREMAKPMVHIELQNVKTIAEYAAIEIVMRVSVLPLRLHVDQDALDFISRFFEFKDPHAVSSDGSPQDQPFLQRVEINTVDLCLDYKPKNIDYAGLRSGRTTEFMNFIILDSTNIRLRHAIVYGLRGFEPLHQTLNDIWMPDVRRNQLPRVLAGLAPVRGIVNLGEGLRNVVAIPIREYRKDGRLLRSIQKGAFQFAKTTTSELARLGAKVAVGTQTALQGAEGFLSPGSASPLGRPGVARRKSSESGWHDLGEQPEQRAISNYADQPVGVWAGLRSARAYLEHDLLTARDAFIAVQGEVLESHSPGAAAAAVARHAPTVILRPVIGATRAVGATLMGVGNQVDRANVRRLEDKYKKR